MNGSLLDYLVVAILGALVGSAELVSRYRDAPARAVLNLPATIYIALNVCASLAALFLIHVYDWRFGLSSTGAALHWAQIGVAGTGAMALFRSSLFTVHAGDRDIGVGPSSFLQIFRDASDRAVDRLRAKARGDQVSKLMAGIDFSKAFAGLPPYCLALMQNVSAEDQVALTKSLSSLAGTAEIDADIKVRILGLQLMNLVGFNVLSAAVDSLREEMKKAAATATGK
jgi:hypothetical protein